MRLTDAPSTSLPLCFMMEFVPPQGGCPAAWVKAAGWASTLAYVQVLLTQVPASNTRGRTTPGRQTRVLRRAEP